VTLFLEQGTGSARAFRRLTLAWDAGGDDAELVLEPGRGGRVRVEVRIGSEREEHELEPGEQPHAAVVRAQSKLIRVEDTRGRQLAVPRDARRKPAVNKQSKLIQIEDLRATLPDVTVCVD
jgi:hypothetical protein